MFKSWKLKDEMPNLGMLFNDFKEIALWFAISRAVILTAGYLAILAVSPADNTPIGSLYHAFIRWDCGWYLDIARNGYSYKEGAQSNVVFLPGYPLLMHIGSLGLMPLKYGALLTSNLCLILAGIFLKRLTILDADESTGSLAAKLLMLSPVSFFFSIIYSESSFLFFSVLCLYHARKERWLLAGLSGYVAALIRSPGLLLTIPLALEVIRNCNPKTLPKFLPLALLPVAGYATYCFYMYQLFGNPLIYQKAEVHWGRQLMPFWETMTRYYTVTLPQFYKVWFYGALIIALLIIAAGLYLKQRSSYIVMALTFVLLYMSSGLLEALPRYLSVVAPFYVILATLLQRLERPAIKECAILASTSLLTFSTILFATGHWFT